MIESTSDSAWAPKSGATFDAIGVVEFAHRSGTDDVPDPDDDHHDGGWFRRNAALAVVAAVIAAVVVVGVVVVIGDVDRGAPDDETAVPIEAVLPAPEMTFDELARVGALDDDGGDVTLGAGDLPLALGERPCAAVRLPTSPEERWAFALPSGAEVVDASVDADTVVAAIDNADGSLVAAAIDVVSGVERWRAPVGDVDDVVRVVGQLDGVVIVERRGFDGAELVGLAQLDGSVLWNERLGGIDSADGVGGVLIRRGIDRDSGEALTQVLDPTSGEAVVGFQNAQVAVDAGRVVSVDTDEISVLDDIDAPLVVVPRPSPGLDVPAVVSMGSTLLVGSESSESLRSIELDETGVPSSPIPVAGSARLRVPATMRPLQTVGPGAVLLAGDGAVHGANLGDGGVELRWRVRGDVWADAPSDRGRLLLIGSDGGATQRVIDASTGREVLDVSNVPGRIADDALAANGVVVSASVRIGGSSGPAWAAYGLNGQLLWLLPGDGQLLIGDRVVVDVVDDTAANSVRVVAYGPTPDGAPQCGTIAREWVSS